MRKLLFGCGTDKDDEGRTQPSLAETSKINAVTSEIIAYAATQVMNESFILTIAIDYLQTCFALSDGPDWPQPISDFFYNNFYYAVLEWLSHKKNPHISAAFDFLNQ